jgi:hypothetical protein
LLSSTQEDEIARILGFPLQLLQFISKLLTADLGFDKASAQNSLLRPEQKDIPLTGAAGLLPDKKAAWSLHKARDDLAPPRSPLLGMSR